MGVQVGDGRGGEQKWAQALPATCAGGGDLPVALGQHSSRGAE